MTPSLWHRLDEAARQLTPLLLTLLFVMLAMMPLGVPALAPVLPWLALIAVYYWSVHRPDLMPAVAVFAVGLFHDLLAGSALGVGMLVLLLVHAVVMNQRRFFRSQSFLVIWFGFAVVGAGAMALVWLFNAVLAGQWIDARPAAFQYLTTVAAYPLLAWVFARVQRDVLRSSS